MSNFDEDEFKNVKKGLPTEGAAQKASLNLIILFGVIGIIIAVLIVLFQDQISFIGEIAEDLGYVPEQVMMSGFLALLIGSIQAWIFRDRIRSRRSIFIAASLLGGVIGGLVSGLLINAHIEEPILLGAVAGALAGGISSLVQNRLMRNFSHGVSWLIYSTLSWAVIFAAGWAIGWWPDRGLDIALAGAFVIIATGVSLAVFLNRTPQIEFS